MHVSCVHGYTVARSFFHREVSCVHGYAVARSYSSTVIVDKLQTEDWRSVLTLNMPIKDEGDNVQSQTVGKQRRTPPHI